MSDAGSSAVGNGDCPAAASQHIIHSACALLLTAHFCVCTVHTYVIHTHTSILYTYISTHVRVQIKQMPQFLNSETHLVQRFENRPKIIQYTVDAETVRAETFSFNFSIMFVMILFEWINEQMKYSGAVEMFSARFIVECFVGLYYATEKQIIPALLSRNKRCTSSEKTNCRGLWVYHYGSTMYLAGL